MFFDERNIFLSHRYNFGTSRNRISTRFWFSSIPSIRVYICIYIFTVHGSRMFEEVKSAITAWLLVMYLYIRDSMYTYLYIYLKMYACVHTHTCIFTVHGSRMFEEGEIRDQSVAARWRNAQVHISNACA